MTIQTRLGRNLKRIRNGSGLSQEQLSFDADVHRSYVSDIERGVRNPTIQIVYQFAQALHVTMGELLD